MKKNIIFLIWKGDENIFKGVSRVPSNYWTGNGIQAMYFLFFYFLGYLFYRFTSFHLKSREMDFKGGVTITAKPTEEKKNLLASF